MENLTEQSPQETGIRARIDRFEANHAVLVTEDGQTLNVLTEYLPDHLEKESAVWLVIHTDASRAAERKHNARALLDEILNPEQL